jgi:hypothetical protein
MPSVSYSVTQLGSTSYMALPKRYSAFLFGNLKAKIEQKKIEAEGHVGRKKRFPFFFSVDPRTLLLIIVLPQNHWCIGTKNIQYCGQNFLGSCVWKKEATM